LRKRVYFVGSSGTGKTTLAAHVTKKWGLSPLPSASRSVQQESGRSYADLRADLDAYNSFQLDVFKRQVKNEAEATGNYVSDRAFDFLIYTAMYGTVAWQIARSDTFRDYMTGLRLHDDGAALMFFVRPTRETWRAAMKQNQRREFLKWEDVLRFDGAVKLILESHEMSYITIDTPVLADRIRQVDAVMNVLPRK